MRYKSVFLLTALLALLTLLFNSCKKDNSTEVTNFLTQGPWQLASLQVLHYKGTLQLKTDTIDISNCSTQTFTFNADNSCSYQNFNCISQSGTGQWQFSTDNLTLQSNVSLQDSAKHSFKVTPFQNSLVVTLGQYSLVLETDSIKQYYPPNTVIQIKRYGFIHSR